MIRFVAPGSDPRGPGWPAKDGFLDWGAPIRDAMAGVTF